VSQTNIASLFSYSYIFSTMPNELDMSDVQQALATIDGDKCQHQVRSMHESDIDILIPIEQATWDEDPWSYEEFLMYLGDPSCNCWVLENTTNTTNNSILGYGFQCTSVEIETHSHIINICIHLNHRGFGLGGILLRHMIDYARATGALAIELEVMTTNKHAFQLYVKHGFTIIKLLYRYYSNKWDAYKMQLNFS
jgi:ribosomal-protein-alanine N-acetyltransferase